MIKRNRMNEIDWIQRLVNLQARLERDAENLQDLEWMMETGTDSPIATVEVQKHLSLVKKLLVDAEKALDYAIELQLEVAYKETKDYFSNRAA